MKKFLLAIIALFCSVSSFGQYSSGGFDLDKENVYYGVRFGGTLASISGDVSVGTKVGLTLGGVVGLRLSTSSPVFLESGLYYTQRGAKDGDYEVTHNNLEIPLVVKYGFKATDEIALLPFIGPYFALGIAGDLEYEKLNAATNQTEKMKESVFDNFLNRNDMGFKLGCGMEYNMLYLEVAYQLGVTNIADDDDFSIHANQLSINFGVNF